MKEPHLPSDQFTRCKDELSKLNLLVDEVERSLTIAEKLHLHDAQRALEKCRTDIETAGYWLGRAVKEITST